MLVIPKEDSICLESLVLKIDTVIVSVSAMGSKFQRVGPEYITLDINKSNLGVVTLSFLEQFLE